MAGRKTLMTWQNVMVLEGEHNRGSEDFCWGLREDEVVALDLEGFVWYEMVEMGEREKKMSLPKGTFWAGAWTPPRTCTWPWWGSLMCDTAGADNAVEWEQSCFQWSKGGWFRCGWSLVRSQPSPVVPDALRAAGKLARPCINSSVLLQKLRSEPDTSFFKVTLSFWF